MKRTLFFLGLLLLFTAVYAGHATAQDCTEPAPGLVSWWPGDGNADEIIGSNNGTLVGGTTFSLGKVDQGFQFDGVDDALESPLIVSYATGTTFDAWIKTTDGRGIIMSGGGGSTPESGMGLFVEPGGKLYLVGTRGIPGQLNFLIGNIFVSDGSFHHVAATWTGDTSTNGVKLYLDGSLVDEGTAAIEIEVDSVPLNIGGHTTLGHWKLNGVIDEVEVFNRVLSSFEIQAIYDAGDAGKCKELPLMTGLIRDVLDLNLQTGIASSLDAKLDTALQVVGDLNEKNDVAATNSLEAFINAVDAQRGNKISDPDADALIAAAQDIIALLGGF